MNYKRHYDLLMARSCKPKAFGYERHRIIPGCLGGRYKKGNFVFLNKREHTFAHLLLTKIYPQNKSLLQAARLMIEAGSCRSSVLYSMLRKQLAEQITQEVVISPMSIFESEVSQADQIYSFPIKRLA